MSMRDEVISGRTAEEEGLAARMHPPDSLKIERDIEGTLSQMRGTLNEIQEKISPERIFAPLKGILLSPAGKMLLALGAVAFARRRPLLSATAALGTMVYLSRRKKRRQAPYSLS